MTAYPRTNPPLAGVCDECGVALHRSWSDHDGLGEWVDEKSRTCGGESPIEGVNGIIDFLGWLEVHDIAAYAEWKCRWDLCMHMLPWEHRHECTVEKSSGEVPYCCDWPMWAIPSGWRCRYGCKQIIPYDKEATCP